ncbi:hypothetical protein NDI43_05475 [Microcoleus vaginatus GB2-A3]
MESKGINSRRQSQTIVFDKTGEITHINRYEVTVKLDFGGDETLMWPYADVWWQDVKTASEQKSQ